MPLRRLAGVRDSHRHLGDFQQLGCGRSHIRPIYGCCCVSQQCHFIDTSLFYSLSYKYTLGSELGPLLRRPSCITNGGVVINFEEDFQMKRLFLVLLLVVMASAMALAQTNNAGRTPDHVRSSRRRRPHGRRAGRSPKLRPRLRRLPCSAQRRMGRRRQRVDRNRHRYLHRRQCPVWSRYGTTVGPDV